VLHTDSVRRERHYTKKRDARNADFRAELAEENSTSRRNVISFYLIFIPGDSWPFCFNTMPVTLPDESFRERIFGP
jgi:hypothetical protein